MATTNEKYIKGFNHGYYLKKHNPDLLKAILQSKSENDYFKGLNEGAKIIEKNRTASRLMELKKSGKDRDLEL